ncbi:MAG: glycoside hydrolase family 28 protein [Sphaerochaetaceae bacterium]|nr:glycoside hydrolase family 28 protein [Sphaerochaetaceae bacterium]
MDELHLVGDGVTDNTKVLTALLEKGGRIVLKEGVYLTGPLEVRSDTHITLEKDAVIKFIDDPELYEPVYTRWEGVQCYCMHPLLYIHNAKNVVIDGDGTLDGNGKSWWETARIKKKQREAITPLEKKFAALNPDYKTQAEGGGGRLSQFLRPALVQIHNSENITIDGLGVINSPFWTIHPVFSKNLKLYNLRIDNPYDSPNTDGIDIESSTDVVVDGCHVDVGDDGIALKSGSGITGIKDARPTSNVIIRRCYVTKAHGGVVIGSETAAGIDHLLAEDCAFDGTDRGIRIKSRRGRGGQIHDITFRNLEMYDCLTPLAVNMYYGCGANNEEENKVLFSLEKQPVTEETPGLYNVEMTNCIAEGLTASASMIVGLPESPVKNLTIKNCHFSVKKDTDVSVDQTDMYKGLPSPEGRGFRIRYAENIVLENVVIDGVDKEILLEDGAKMA